jgi:meso-butanediol dehydrogenase/(S,S)-butanediol dehydrogenase/diacetyl reductase
MGKLDNRVAIVTGSARGLGAGIAQALGREGAFVVCADVLDAGDVAASLPAAETVVLDVTDPAAVASAFDRVADEHGSLDILANNAGVAQPIADVVDTDDAVIDRVFAVNFRSVVNCSRAAVPHMRRQGKGKIINTASQTGKQAWPGWGIYSASKFAVVGLTQVMALELAKDGITVNAVCPGTMVTDMMYTGFGEAAAAAGVDRDGLIAEKAASIPMGRMGTAEDVGNLVAFIASDECSFTTGGQFNLTGGEMVWF